MRALLCLNRYRFVAHAFNASMRNFKGQSAKQVEDVVGARQALLLLLCSSALPLARKKSRSVPCFVPRSSGSRAPVLLQKQRRPPVLRAANLSEKSRPTCMYLKANFTYVRSIF